MTIELLKKGDEYLVRYKRRWVWWYVGYDGDWFWPDYGSEMDLEEAREVIERLKTNEEHSRADTAVIETIDV